MSLFSGKQSEQDKKIKQFYELYKESFLLFATKNYGIDEETIHDIYQESFWEMCQNIQNGKYKESKASLKTYLFAIGKNKTCKYLREKNRQEESTDNRLFFEWMEEQYEQTEWNRIQDIAYQLVHEAKDDCTKVLSLFYWKKKKLKEIARDMNYKSEQVAKNKRLSCIRRLTHELKLRLREADIEWRFKI